MPLYAFCALNVDLCILCIYSCSVHFVGEMVMAQNIVIYPEKESKLIEFKEKLSSLSNIIKTCVAFANGAGGEVIIGVKDKTREIVGVSEKDENDFYESIPNKIFDTISPLIVPDFMEKNFGDKNVFIIKIHPGSKKPYYIKKDGLAKGVYIRVGPHNRKLPPEEIELLINTSKGVTYDAQAINETLEIVKNSLFLKEAYGKKLSEGLLAREGVLKKEPNGSLFVSRAAVLMFSDNPEVHIPEAVVICTLFKGESGRNIVHTREITGPIPTLVEEVISATNHWLERNFKLKGAKLTGSLPIPPIALREAIVNALIHRKYSIPGAVKIAIYDNRVEIFSPGQFPGTISPENIGDGSTHLRNPVLAKFARKLRLVEKLGSGIKTIFEECRKMRIKRPDFFEDGDFVKVVFYFEQDKTVRTELTELIMEKFKENDILRIEDILKITDVSRNTVTNSFKKLMEQKLVTRIGRGRGVCYKLSI